MVVSRPKTGHNPDALFTQPHPYMWNGERGGDTEVIRRREAREAAKKNLTPNGFAFTSPAQKMEGLGSHYGTIGGSIPHMARHREFRGIPPKKDLPPRSIYTSPAKKGGYGYAHTGLSEVGCDYIASYYHQKEVEDRKYREEWRKKMPETVFKPGGRRGFTFDEATGTGVSKVYMMTQPFQPKKEEVRMTHFLVAQPWRPAGYVEDMPTKMDYWEDPYGGYDPRIPPKDQVKKASDKIFYPSGRCDDFWYTQSIVMKRI